MIFMERLDKILSNLGGMTRSEARTQIKCGHVTVNGIIVKDFGFKINDSDEVISNGAKINTAKFRYFMLNKPKGFISSTEPEPGDESPNVISLFKKEGIKDLFPVGRLDKDTTGLLIVTNDGAFAHKLTAPGKHVDKTYYDLVKGLLDQKAVDDFKKGIEFKEFTSLPSKLVILETDKEKGISKALVTLNEGKFHQVKRMFSKTGCEVTELKRISIGKLRLDESLGYGEYREFCPEEVFQPRML